MLGDFSVKNMLNSIIPISRFNKGEANKIFDEVSQSGYKIVVKNNSPTCVLLTPKKYEELMEIVEDYYLLAEASTRQANDKGITFSQSEVMKRLGISEKSLNDIEVKIDGLDD